MRYFKLVDEGYHEWGDPTYLVEVNDAGAAQRQIADYPNGKTVSYDRSHQHDQYGGLGLMVVDGDEEWWAPFSITRQEFEERWDSHRPVNR